MAIGARPGEIAVGVLRGGAIPVLLGVAAGILLTVSLAPAVEGMLFGVRARDPLAFATVGALLVTVSLAASYVPARRASRVDPMSILREE
jgi:ABC-type lipoprotein release transport system permease subunit